MLLPIRPFRQVLIIFVSDKQARKSEIKSITRYKFFLVGK